MNDQSVFRSFLLTVLLASLGWALLPGQATAHTVRPAVVTVNVAEPGQVKVRIRLTAEQLLARIGPEYADTNDAPNAAEYDALRELEPGLLTEQFAGFVPEFMAEVGVQVDGAPASLRFLRIDVPPVGDTELPRDSEVFLQGELPAGAALTWSWPQRFGSHVLRVVGDDPEKIMSAWLQPGEQAPPYQLGGDNARSRLAVIVDYLIIGFEHIVPLGIDHILFVLGLFLLSLHLKPLLWQVTAFTVAHTITLGLSIYGVVELSPAIVEPLIALSIVYVGIENCLYSTLKPWRVLLVFGFGLLHGLGFAGVLSEIGLPQDEFLTALLSFNVGVELGQLTVILLALLCVGWWRNRSWYRSVVVVPGSLLISLTGAYWVWERVFG